MERAVVPRTDAQLIADFATKGAREAFDEIVVRYSRLVYSVCFRVIGDPHAAEDACQTTFMVLMQKAPDLQGQPTLAPWLCVVAQRSAQKLKRTELRREAHTHAAVAQGNAMNQNEAYGLWEQIRPNLDTALDGLRPAEREAIVLRYLQGLSSAAASNVLGCPVRTFNARLHSGLSSLRQQLQKHGLTVSAPALLVMMDTFPMEPLPGGLAASIQNVCHGDCAASSQITQAVFELSKCSLRVVKSLGSSAAWPIVPILLVTAAAATAVGLSLPRSAEVSPAQAPITAAPVPAVPAKKTTIELFTRPEHLANWKIKSPSWQVEGNCLVGQGQQGNAFLCSSNLPGDFVLSLTATAESSFQVGWWGADSRTAIHLAWGGNELSLMSYVNTKNVYTVLTKAHLGAGKHVYRVIRVGGRVVVYADGQKLFSCQQLVDEPIRQLGLFVPMRVPVRFENITLREADADDLPPEK